MGEVLIRPDENVQMHRELGLLSICFGWLISGRHVTS
jgi:hypothetical protein